MKSLRPPPPRRSEETVEIKGTLRGLHLDQDWLEVVTEGSDPQKPTRIHETGDVLDDVAGPMVNHRVVVTAIQRRARLVYQDVEAEE